MRYGVFSDIHGNLEALEAVFGALRKEAVDVFFCGGDIVGYGANPKECLDLVRSSGARTVAGNHDWAVAAKVDLEIFNPFAKAAVLWTRTQLSDEDIRCLADLPLVHFENDFLLVHAVLPDPHRFHYLASSADAERMFDAMGKDVAFIGHTHAPEVIRRTSTGVRQERSSGVRLAPGQRTIVNVGSVGQPRDGDPRAAYALFDTDARGISIHRVAYDVAGAQEKIRRAGLPEMLASRLETGE